MEWNDARDPILIEITYHQTRPTHLVRRAEIDENLHTSWTGNKKKSRIFPDTHYNSSRSVPVKIAKLLMSFGWHFRLQQQNICIKISLKCSTRVIYMRSWHPLASISYTEQQSLRQLYSVICGLWSLQTSIVPMHENADFLLPPFGYYLTSATRKLVFNLTLSKC